jgi:beta-glucosidase/6-phospho-beta-glucosidase/beta-galactosidase
MSLFQSFWMAGFESACHRNSKDVRLDMIAATQHDAQADADYARLREMGLLTARDGVRWHLVDRAGKYDFASLAPLVEAARQHGIQVIWNLCHYGWPDDVDIFAPAFVDRFRCFCHAVARYMREQSDDVPFYAPVNEISFVAWSIGHRGFMFPHAVGRSGEVKKQLVRAAIAGCEAVWSVDRRARFVHTDPVIHIIPPRGRPDLAAEAVEKRAAQFHAFDMLAGRLDPELGGDPKYLDIVAVNFYHANEWELPENRLRWEDTPRDERWVPLHRLLAEVHARYERPMIISETSHFGVGRAPWLREIADEVRQALKGGVPLQGVCIYPILDRPDWEDLSQWHNSGLWDLNPTASGRLERVLHEEYGVAVRQAQQRTAGLERRCPPHADVLLSMA